MGNWINFEEVKSNFSSMTKTDFLMKVFEGRVTAYDSNTTEAHDLSALRQDFEFVAGYLGRTETGTRPMSISIDLGSKRTDWDDTGLEEVEYEILWRVEQERRKPWKELRTSIENGDVQIPVNDAQYDELAKKWGLDQVEIIARESLFRKSEIEHANKEINLSELTAAEMVELIYREVFSEKTDAKNFVLHLEKTVNVIRGQVPCALYLIGKLVQSSYQNEGQEGFRKYTQMDIKSIAKNMNVLESLSRDIFRALPEELKKKPGKKFDPERCQSE